jgi:peptidylprolyl isomerase
MTKTSPFSCILLCAAAAVWPLAAQTAAPKSTPPAASTHATTHSAAIHAAGCVAHPPEISSKIPALPASAPCVKTLYTVTRIPTTKVDYVSPLVSKEVREGLGTELETYSLDYVDTQIGTGALVEAHDFFTVKYTGYLEKEGTKFDSSDDHPNKEPISFPYGSHRVIPGWDTGFEGMHVGGKRRVFIPWELAYGEGGRPPVIPAKANLVFDLELVSQSASPPPPPQGTRPPTGPGAHPGMPTHPPTGAPTAPPSGTATPPAGSPPATPPAQPQSTPPPAGNPPTGTTTAPTPPAGTAATPKPQ